MRVVFFTGHAADSPRKTGFHFWSDILGREGHQVDWITLGFSCLSYLKPKRPLPAPPYNRWATNAPHLRSFIWCPFFHPVDLGFPLLNRLAVPFFNLYPCLLPETLTASFQEADLVITEVGTGLMLIPALAKLNPAAKLIYFVADRPQTVGAHPAILQAEKKALPHFCLIRVPAETMTKDYDPSLPVRYIPQGVPKALLDAPHPSPYNKDKNVISVGDMLFDARAVETLARVFPDWTFHLFGRGAKLAAVHTNVREYGEISYEQMIPYLQHADIALAPYQAPPGADYLAQSSLKLMQYIYCRLPVVAPDFMVKGRSFIKGYDSTTYARLTDAFAQAGTVDPATIDTSAILDWSDVLTRMMQ